MNKFLLAATTVLCVLVVYLSYARIGLQRELAAARAESVLLTEEAVSLRVKLAAYEGDLAREKERVERLSTPAVASDAVSIKELGAVPELYVNKELQVEGQLFDNVVIADPVTWFRVAEGDAFMHCVFKPQDLDANSRRLLVSKGRGDRIRILGRYVPNGEGVFQGRTHTGYEFVVLQVVE